MDDGARHAAAELAALFDADVAEHAQVPRVGTADYAALRARDRERRARARDAVARLRAAGAAPPEALYHAAWLLNHGEVADDAREAHALAREAADGGHAPARWLSAAAYDRSCMYDGRPQRYGTQFVPDGVRVRLWDVVPETTDAERMRWDAPPLAEQLARAAALSRSEPQPPLAHAPAWLLAALPRWRAADGTVVRAGGREVVLTRLSAVEPAALVALMNDARVRRHLPLARAAFDEAACARFVAAKERIWAEHGYGPFAFLADGELAGWGGLQPEGDDVDLGLVLHPRAWGMAPALLRRLLALAFDELRVPSVIVLLPPSRVRVGALRRLGFAPDGEVTLDGAHFVRWRLWAPGRGVPGAPWAPHAPTGAGARDLA